MRREAGAHAREEGRPWAGEQGQVGRRASPEERP